MLTKLPSNSWAIRVAQFVDKIGPIKGSILFVLCMLFFVIAGSYAVRFLLGSSLQQNDLISASVLTIIGAPCLLYFVGKLVKELEHSRTNLEEAVSQLERLRRHDVILNRELQNNIRQLNYEIEQRKHAQTEREMMFAKLEQEIKENQNKNWNHVDYLP